MYTRKQKTKRLRHIKTTAPYGAPNQSTKSSIDKEPSYALVHSYCICPVYSCAPRVH